MIVAWSVAKFYRGFTARARFSAAKVLLAGFFAVGYLPSSSAADVGIRIALSPETAHMIRDWRRANGLPQAPEETQPRAQVEVPIDSSKAVAKAMRFASIEAAASDDLLVAASRMHASWLVKIHRKNTPDSADYVIEVGDSVANSPVSQGTL